VRALIKARRRVWVDSSGPALRAAVQSRPAVIKVNGLEAAGLLGWKEIQDIPTALQAAQTIQQSGMSQVVVTLGKLGAVLASDAGAWFAHPPEIQVVCPIGSGDAFLGGLVLAWLNQDSDPDALRRAVAAGTANALMVGGGRFTRQEFERILSLTSIKKLT
jgi:fructose-1-phosphate kinase PfkB-like protein